MISPDDISQNELQSVNYEILQTCTAAVHGITFRLKRWLAVKSMRTSTVDYTEMIMGLNAAFNSKTLYDLLLNRKKFLLTCSLRSCSLSLKILYDAWHMKDTSVNVGLRHPWATSYLSPHTHSEQTNIESQVVDTFPTDCSDVVMKTTEEILLTEKKKKNH